MNRELRPKKLTKKRCQMHWLAIGQFDAMPYKLPRSHEQPYAKYVAGIGGGDYARCELLARYFDQHEIDHTNIDMMVGFDWEVYCVFNDDLWKADIRTQGLSIKHWNDCGKHEHRKTRLTKELESKYRDFIAIYSQTYTGLPRLEYMRAFYAHIYPLYYPIKHIPVRFTLPAILPNIAAILHLGNIDLWDECAENLRKLDPIQFDLWVTIPQINQAQTLKIQSMRSNILDTFPRANVIVVPNQGFDIGGFFYAFKQMLQHRTIYKYVLKIHTKSDESWRKPMISTYIDNADRIISAMENNDNIGMVGWDKKILHDVDTCGRYMANKFHITSILERLDMSDVVEYTYVTGTMFWARACILYDVFKDNIEWFASKLNDAHSFDTNWMWLNNETHVGNLLWETAKPHHKRDGMFEHAVERIFGHIVTMSGRQIYGVQSIADDKVDVDKNKVDKLLVLYVFHLYNERVEHFIKNCIFDDDNVDFVVISNNKDTVFAVPDKVKVLMRDNIGYDFGGWSEALLTNDLYEKYDKFIFVNSSAIGPYIPHNYVGKWTDIYMDGLVGDVKLFGSTINTCGVPLQKSHVQSYIFSMDCITLRYLIGCGIFCNMHYAEGFLDAVDKEIQMSRKIIENGWNIGSRFSLYDGVDFTFRSKTPDEYDIEFLDDIMRQEYKNTLWNENQLVFVKGNRIRGEI